MLRNRSLLLADLQVMFLSNFGLKDGGNRRMQALDMRVRYACPFRSEFNEWGLKFKLQRLEEWNSNFKSIQLKHCENKLIKVPEKLGKKKKQTHAIINIFQIVLLYIDNWDYLCKLRTYILKRFFLWIISYLDRMS